MRRSRIGYMGGVLARIGIPPAPPPPPPPPPPAPSFSAAYVTNAVRGNEFENPKVFSGVSIGAADPDRKVYAYLFVRFPSTTAPVTLSVNGGTAITPLESVRVNSNRQIFLFVADVPTGTTADFSFSATGADLNNGTLAVIRAVGGHAAATSPPFDDFGTSPAISLSTNAGDSVFIGAMYGSDGGAGFFTPPAGFTEHFDGPTRPSIPAQPAALFGGTAAGGAPETFTAGVSDGGGTAALLLRLRASGSPPPPPPPPSGGAITPAVQVTYVDPSGVRQSVNALDSGTPTITGVAPMLVSIDATGTRAPTAFAAYSGSEALYLPSSYPASTDQTAQAQEAYAHLACGYRINYGGATGAGNWAYPEGQGASKNEDAGQPLWPAVFTEVGTHTIRLRVRDELGNEATVSFNVVVQAPPTATHIPVSAGSWPTFTSGSRYTLDAGGDYRSFGAINTGSLHNVICEKVGAGADPRVLAWNVDPRSKFGETVSFPTRARHVRFVGIDVDQMVEGQRGFDFCGAINGRTRLYVSGGQSSLFAEGNANEQSACRFTRGCFFVGGELNNIGAPSGYVLFGTWHSLFIMGCNVNAIDTGPSTWLVMRTYGTKHSYRHLKIRINHAETSSCGTPLSILCEEGLNETVWPDNDRPAAIGSTDKYGMRCEHSHIYRCQYSDATGSRANAVFSSGGNPVGLRLVRPWLVGSEDSVFYPSGSIALLTESYQLQGRASYLRNSRRNMGAGTSVGYVTQNPNSVNNPSNTDTAWDGPYGAPPARPVPTAF